MDNCVFISWGVSRGKQVVRSWRIMFDSHFFQLMLNIKESFVRQDYSLFLHDREKLREAAEAMEGEQLD